MNMPPTSRSVPEKMLAAFTATTYPGDYPPYINIRQVGSMVRISVRGTCHEDGSMGDCAVFVVNVWTADQIAKALSEAVREFETGLDTPPDSFA